MLLWYDRASLLAANTHRSSVWSRLESMRTPIEKLSICEIIINTAVKVCVSNWLRSTYSEARAPTGICQPISITFTEPSCERSRRWSEYFKRFNVVARFLSPDMIEQHLHAMETAALKRQDFSDSEHSDSAESADDFMSDTAASSSSRVTREEDSMSIGDSSESSSVHELLVSNPRRRSSKKSKRKYYNK